MYKMPQNFHGMMMITILLLFGIFSSTFSSFRNKQRKVFDNIQLGVPNPADTVSAPQSIALLCHVFLFFGSVLKYLLKHQNLF